MTWRNPQTGPSSMLQQAHPVNIYMRNPAEEQFYPVHLSSAEIGGVRTGPVPQGLGRMVAAAPTANPARGSASMMRRLGSSLGRRRINPPQLPPPYHVDPSLLRPTIPQPIDYSQLCWDDYWSLVLLPVAGEALAPFKDQHPDPVAMAKAVLLKIFWYCWSNQWPCCGEDFGDACWQRAHAITSHLFEDEVVDAATETVVPQIVATIESGYVPGPAECPPEVADGAAPGGPKPPAPPPTPQPPPPSPMARVRRLADRLF